MLQGEFAYSWPIQHRIGENKHSVWLLGNNYFGRAYHTILWPFLGFLFMPLTTLAYAFAMNSNNGSVHGIYLVLVVLAVLIDLGIIGGGSASRRRRSEMS